MDEIKRWTTSNSGAIKGQTSLFFFPSVINFFVNISVLCVPSPLLPLLPSIPTPFSLLQLHLSVPSREATDVIVIFSSTNSLIVRANHLAITTSGVGRDSEESSSKHKLIDCMHTTEEEEANLQKKKTLTSVFSSSSPTHPPTPSPLTFFPPSTTYLLLLC